MDVNKFLVNLVSEVWVVKNDPQQLQTENIQTHQLKDKILKEKDALLREVKRRIGKN